MNSKRFERQISIFGKEGQEQIRKAHVTVVGIGGLGSHVVQQLALLGVGNLSLVDPDELEMSNLNRLIGACHEDPIPGTKKVDIAKRLVNSIDPHIYVNTLPKLLRSKEAFSEIEQSSHVFGCVDNDGSRLVLNELCVAFEIPYFDLASDIIGQNGLDYGGRVFINFDNKGCLCCYDVISREEIRLDLSSADEKKDHEAIYGVAREHLGQAGPSVVSIDGVIASLAITEFVVMSTKKLRLPNRYLRYDGNRGIVNQHTNRLNQDCYYCKKVRGSREDANVNRYYE